MNMRNPTEISDAVMDTADGEKLGNVYLLMSFENAVHTEMEINNNGTPDVYKMGSLDELSQALLYMGPGTLVVDPTAIPNDYDTQQTLKSITGGMVFDGQKVVAHTSAPKPDIALLHNMDEGVHFTDYVHTSKQLDLPSLVKYD